MAITNFYPTLTAEGFVSTATAVNFRYSPQTAGYMMCTAFLAVERDMTVGAAVELIHAQQLSANAKSLLAFDTAYVVDNGGHLLGVISIAELRVANPLAVMREIMHHPAVCVTTGTSLRRAARILADNNLSVVPVIDDDFRLVGVVDIAAVSAISNSVASTANVRSTHKFPKLSMR